jgi:hypothetical protein
VADKPTLTDFILETLVFEVRYADALQLWDSAGEIWSELCTKLPGLTLQAADPRAQTFTLGDNFELTTDLKRAAITDFKPSRESERLAEIATLLLDQIVKSLRLPDFSRVGLRAMYWKDAKSISGAVKDMSASNLTKAMVGPLSGKDSAQTEIQYGTRFETETSGIAIRLASQTRQVNLDVAMGARRYFESKKIEEHGVILDVDYYTRGVVGAEQIRPRVWIDQAMAIAKRAIRGMLENQP